MLRRTAFIAPVVCLSVISWLCAGAIAKDSLGPPAASNAFQRTDFNGDGSGDLAVGVPGETVTDDVGAGAVNVIYGSGDGLTSTGDQIWTQDSPGIQGTSEQGDAFGNALATGDFNGDGRTDLAIAVEFEKVGSVAFAGAVNVLYGSSTGLTSTGDQIWTQNSTGILDKAETNDRFGLSLAAGDFNGDGRSDLAVGTPFESVGIVPGAGSVNVILGSSTGLTATGNQFWTQSAIGLDPLEEGDGLGYALATGDFNFDLKSDLAIGAPTEDVGIVGNAGAVNVLYGSATGLGKANAQFWTQDTADILDSAEADDEFGRALAAGDFNGDIRVELAVGVPDEDVGTVVDAGAVSVIVGSTTGLVSTGNQLWTQDSAGILDTAETGDEFGFALATGNFNGDGGRARKVDLAVGVPFESVGALRQAGAVNVLYGAIGGLRSTSNQLWTQNSTGFLGASEFNNFGRSIVSRDFNDDTMGDLAIGVPYQKIGNDNAAGLVDVLYGFSTGLGTTGDQIWSQDSAGINGTADAGDGFGDPVD